jgi:phage-related baseplate assembly protein
MANTIAQLMALPDVTFVDTSVNDMLAAAITTYQNTYLQQTGQSIVLQPGDDEYIMLYSVALIAYQQLQSINFAAKQNFLKYATGNNLKQLGANTGNIEASPEAAVTALTFTLGTTQSTNVTIPQGTRGTPGNGLYFATDQAATIPIGNTAITTSATCTVTGSVGNGYILGTINILTDSVPFVASVTNSETTEGGSDAQTDASFQAQVFASPSGYSVAGPASAYDYFARQYSSSVIDTLPVSPSPNVINHYILLTGGTLPNQTFLNELMAYIGASDRRPMTDQYTALAPAVQNYTINLTYYIDPSNAGQAATIQAAVTTAVNNFVTQTQSLIGQDIVPDSLTAAIRGAGAKRAMITSPIFTTTTSTAIAVPSAVTVTYGGLDAS